MPVRHLRSHLPLAGVIFVAACAGLAPLVDRQATAPELPGFGVVRTTVTTNDPAARQWFLQGMQQAYAFNEREAVRSFKAALALDAQCAACAWGVAWQLGPNINAVERGDLREAARYARLAQSVAGNATPLERALIDAMVVRYADAGGAAGAGLPQAAICGSGGSSKAHPLDIAYALQLQHDRRHLARDPDAVSLYAEAELVATPDDWWDPKTGKPAGRIGEVADRLERALAKNVEHTGLNHYLVHAVDAPGVAQRAVAAADRLGALAPQAPHLVHMPSHTYVHVAATPTRRARAGPRLPPSKTSTAVSRPSASHKRRTGTVTTGTFSGCHADAGPRRPCWKPRGGLRRASRPRPHGVNTSADCHCSRSCAGAAGAMLEEMPALARRAHAGDVRVCARHRAGPDRARRRDRRMVAALDERLRSARAAAKPDDDFAKMMVERLVMLSSQLEAEVAFARGDVDAALVAGREAIRAEKPWAANRHCSPGAARSRWAICSCAPNATRKPKPRFGPTSRSSRGRLGLRGLQSAVAAQNRDAEAQQVQAEWARAWQEADAALRPASRT
jgi:hypothetical protein